MPTTSGLLLPYPALSAAPNVPADIQALADRLEALYGPAGSAAAWTAYTPTWGAVTTAPTLGNGTIVGRYARLGKTIHFRLRIVMGSTTTYGSGAYFFSVPVTMRSLDEANSFRGVTLNSNNTRIINGHQRDATTFSALLPDGTFLTQGVPGTLVNSAWIDIGGTCEAS